MINIYKSFSTERETFCVKSDCQTNTVTCALVSTVMHFIVLDPLHINAVRTFAATPLCAPLAHYYCVPPVLAHLYPTIHTPLSYQDTPHSCNSSEQSLLKPCL